MLKSAGSFMGDTLGKLWEWVTDIFSWDNLKKIVKDASPAWVSGVFGLGDDEEKESPLKTNEALGKTDGEIKTSAANLAAQAMALKEDIADDGMFSFGTKGKKEKLHELQVQMNRLLNEQKRRQMEREEATAAAMVANSSTNNNNVSSNTTQVSVSNSMSTLDRQAFSVDS
jgi:hypothetical protein